MYPPLPSVTTLRAKPVSVCVTVTVTPGRTAPLSSRTVPLICAVACAQAVPPASMRINAAAKPLRKNSFIEFPLLEAKFDAELHDPWQTFLCEDAPERARVEVGDRVPPVERVEQVERFDSQLQRA